MIRGLNSLLKGEQNAVESFEKYISAVSDDSVRNELRSIQGEHREHVEMLAGRIRELGGKADYNTGLRGFLSNARLAVETNAGKKPVEVLKRIYDDEDRGIATAEGIRQDLDAESKSLVNGIISQDHRHLKSMLSLMTRHADPD